MYCKNLAKNIPKSEELKKKVLAFILTVVFSLCLSACGNDAKPTEDTADAPVESGEQEIPEIEEASVENDETGTEEPDDGSVKSGSYTLPCGMKIQFFDYVRNDVTGNWRRATTSDSLVPADYALEYYNEMFSSDDEIHSIWNATLGTNTRLSASGGILFVDTLEYVKGEEHDANLMFSGMKLDSKMIDIETGELVE